jgi:hypothetical protein
LNKRGCKSKVNYEVQQVLKGVVSEDDQFDLSSFRKEKNIDCKKESSKLKRSAHHIPFTRKPSMSSPAINIIMALIISKKRPKVIMVTGRVRMIRMGFTIRLSRLKTIATMSALTYESTSTLGSTLAKTSTAKALRSILKTSFIISLV